MDEDERAVLTRLLFDLHDRNTEDDPDLTRAERLTVLDFLAITKHDTAKGGPE